jgi:8-oxo-dGTP pyrophosphatase MutT (NUDIX family)
VATTAVFAEILIVGLEAAAWLGLLVLGLLDSRGFHVAGLKGWETLTTVIVAAGAYALGILVDRIADSIFQWHEDTATGIWLNERFGERSYWDDLPAPVKRMRFAVMKEGGGMAPFLEYQRSRIRIARATILNLMFSIPAGVLYLIRRGDVSEALIIGYGLGVLGLVCASVYAGERIRTAYIRGLSTAWELLDLPKRRSRAERCHPSVAAAVCWRRRLLGPEFLLVRTSGGGRWTFPKGHVREGEEPSKAAVREANEEAGVTKLRGGCEPLGQYLYPGGSEEGAGEEVCVAAYLMEVERQAEPSEPNRDPRWFRSAAKQLAKRRRGRYAREHRRVLNAAMRRLTERG